jgi:hypothetical protein
LIPNQASGGPIAVVLRKGRVMYRRMWLVVVASMMLMGLASAPASASASRQLPLYSGDLSCTGAPFNEGPPTVGFAVIQPDPAASVIASEVSLKGAEANTTYSVRIIETPGGSDCFTQAGTIQTNGQGNGNTHVQEPLIAGTTGAFIFVQSESTLEFYSTPDYSFGSS